MLTAGQIEAGHLQPVIGAPRPTPTRLLRSVVVYAVLVALGLIFTLPLLWMVTTSLKEQGQPSMLNPATARRLLRLSCNYAINPTWPDSWDSAGGNSLKHTLIGIN